MRQVLIGLLQAVITWGNFDEMILWSATLSNETKGLLSRMGFTFLNKTGTIASDTNLPMILTRPVRQEILRNDWALAGRRLLDLSNWDLRMIFSDDF